MENFNKIKESILNNKITLFCTNQNNVDLIRDLIYSLSFEDDKATFMHCIEENNTTYTSELISKISGISSTQIEYYLSPCVPDMIYNFSEKQLNSKFDIPNIDRNKYIDAVEKIQNKKIFITDKKTFSDEDNITHIFNTIDSDVIIVDDFFELLRQDDIRSSDALKRIKEEIDGDDSHIVLFVNNPSDMEIDLLEYGYIDNYISDEWIKDVE